MTPIPVGFMNVYGRYIKLVGLRTKIWQCLKMGDPQVTMVLILRFLPTWMIWGSRTITLKGNADDLGSESKDLAG